MAGKAGRFALIEQLMADGIRCMFGNPGTVEEGFLDALGNYPDFRYIFALEEACAVGMADGYARSTRRPAVVQLHSGVGLGNGVGMLYQAKRGHSPLVVLAGDAGLRYDAMDGQMAANLVEIARPVTKWAGRVLDPSSLLRVVRRAIKMAATPPSGPVFIDLPQDVLDAANDENIVPTSVPETRVVPEDRLIERAAAWLAGASEPLVIMGDGVAASGAQAELSELAKAVGARVWGANSSEVNLGARDPLFCGLLGHMFGADSQKRTATADVVLICGTYVFPEVYPALDHVFRPGAKVIHIDLDLYEIAKNFPVGLGLLGDPKLTLGRLADALRGLQSNSERRSAEARVAEIAAANRAADEAQRQADRARRDEVPLRLSRFAEELAAQLPAGSMIFDESLTHSPELCRYLPPEQPGHYFQTRGGSLGVGIPGAIGAKLAHPDRTVFGFTGDGGAMYTIQSLWTAAHEGIGAKFVICNNRSYRLLKLNILQYWRERGTPEHAFPASFDVGAPALRFDELARAMGVEAERVQHPEQIAPAIRRALDHPGPYLIDLLLEGEVPAAHPAAGGADHEAGRKRRHARR